MFTADVSRSINVLAGPVNDPEHGAANIPRLCGEPGEAVPEDAGARFLDLFDGVWTSKYTAIRANFEKLLHAGASMQGLWALRSAMHSLILLVLELGYR